jgi:hypothetical protein
MVTVEVYKNSQPLEGANVDVYWGMLYNFGRSGRTGRDGRVHLDMPELDGKIIVQGNKVFEGRISGRMVFHL